MDAKEDKHHSLGIRMKTIGGQDKHIQLRLDLNEFIQRDIMTYVSNGFYYEHELSTFLWRVLRPGDVVVDGGANIGYFTCLMGALVEEGGRVVACEPNDRLLPALRRHVETNKVSAEIVAAALSDHVGTARFLDNGAHDHNGALLTHDGPVDTAGERSLQEVPVVTLDELADRLGLTERVKLIKLDIEGAELKALTGARRLLERETLEFVVCEFNEPQLRLFGADGAMIRERLRACGFEAYALSHESGLPLHIPVGSFINAPYVVNILFARPPALAKYWPVFDAPPMAYAVAAGLKAAGRAG